MPKRVSFTVAAYALAVLFTTTKPSVALASSPPVTSAVSGELQSETRIEGIDIVGGGALRLLFATHLPGVLQAFMYEKNATYMGQSLEGCAIAAMGAHSCGPINFDDAVHIIFHKALFAGTSVIVVDSMKPASAAVPSSDKLELVASLLGSSHQVWDNLSVNQRAFYVSRGCKRDDAEACVPCHMRETDERATRDHWDHYQTWSYPSCRGLMHDDGPSMIVSWKNGVRISQDQLLRHMTTGK